MEIRKGFYINDLSKKKNSPFSLYLCNSWSTYFSNEYSALNQCYAKQQIEKNEALKLFGIDAESVRLKSFSFKFQLNAKCDKGYGRK